MDLPILHYSQTQLLESTARAYVKQGQRSKINWDFSVYPSDVISARYLPSDTRNNVDFPEPDTPEIEATL